MEMEERSSKLGEEEEELLPETMGLGGVEGPWSGKPLVEVQREVVGGEGQEEEEEGFSTNQPGKG